MSFINTLDVIGDDALTDSLIERTITEYKDNEVTVIGDQAFSGCSLLTICEVPVVTSVGSSAFSSCTALERLDFTALTKLPSLYYLKSLRSLILRNTVMVTGPSSYMDLNETPIKKGTGYIYVPSTLVDTYKAATNWSNYANQFRALEDYTVDGTITGELDLTKI